MMQFPGWPDAGPNVLMQVLGCSDAGPDAVMQVPGCANFLDGNTSGKVGALLG